MKRFLIIGLGSIGRRHLRNLATLFPDAALYVLRHTQHRDTEATELGATLLSDPDTALAITYDLIVLATPSANHIDLLPRLIAKGDPLLAEKPIVSDLTDCDLISALLNTAPPARRASGFNFRYLPSLQHARNLIQNGSLGRLARASFTAGLWLPDWRVGQDYTKGYSADARRGGGVELDLVHEVDVARWFFGELYLEYAAGGHFSGLDLMANDTSLMVLRPIQEGPLIQIALDYVARQRIRRYEIIGDAASLIWDLTTGSLSMMTPDGTKILTAAPSAFDVSQTYLTMIQQLMTPPTGADQSGYQDLSDGIASTRLALQARDRSTSS